MKRSAIIRIIVFALIILMLGWLLAAGIARENRVPAASNTSDSTTPTDKTSAGAEGRETSASGTDSGIRRASHEITELEIDWVSGSVTIQPGDTDVILYEETGSFDSKYAMVATESEHKLKIDFCEDSVAKGFEFHIGMNLNASSPKKDLTVTVPRNWECTKLTIENVSAPVSLSGLSVGELEYDGVSGTFTLTDCTVTDLSADTVSGGISFSGTLDEADLDTTSGSIQMTLSDPAKSIEVDSVSGGVDIAYPDNCGFTARFDAVSGKFSSEIGVTASNGTYISGDGSCRIRMDSVSGGMRIHRK